MNFDYSIRFVCKYLDFNNFKLNYTYKAIDITNQKEYDYLKNYLVKHSFIFRYERNFAKEDLNEPMLDFYCDFSYNTFYWLKSLYIL
jgi:hypothetical protein